MKNKWFLRTIGGLSALVVGVLMAFTLAHAAALNGTASGHADDCAANTGNLFLADPSYAEVTCKDDEWCCRHDFSQPGNPCVKCCKKDSN